MTTVNTMLFAVLLGLASLPSGAFAAEALVKIGWCARTITSAAAPFAIATRMGWYQREGIKVQLVPVAGSADCVKLVATGELAYSLSGVEPLPAARKQGVKARIFYTAYQGNILGIAVAAAGPVRSVRDLRGRKIGVASMGSNGVVVARALLAMNGLDPDADAQVVVAGEAAQAAALLGTGQVAALSLYDTQFALIEQAGLPLRVLDSGPLARFPSNGFLAREDTLQNARAQAVGLVRGYAMGTVFAMANPEAAVRIVYEVFPQAKPTGKSDAEALRDGVKTLLARAQHWRLEVTGAKRWGESLIADFDAYEDFLLKWKVISSKVPAGDLVTNELIDDANQFDAAQVAADARKYGL